MSGGGDAKFFARVSRVYQFTQTRWRCANEKSVILQGKVAELRVELNSDKKDKNHARKKIALEKIVANMTMSNNDMAALFRDGVRCMQSPALEIMKRPAHITR